MSKRQKQVGSKDSSLGLWDNLSHKFPVFSFSLVHAQHKRYVWGLFFAMFLPTVQVLLLLFFSTEDYSGGGYMVWYYRIFFRIGLFFLTSLVALLVGTGMFRDILNDETIVYLVTKPIKRDRIWFETYFAYIVITFVVTTPAFIVYHFVGHIAINIYDSQMSLSILDSLFNLVLELVAVYIVLLGLGSIFVLTGYWLKRPLLVNLLIAFGIIVEAFLLDLISNNFEPYYIASNMVANEFRGLVLFPDQRLNIIRFFALGIDFSTVKPLLNFLIVLVLTLLTAKRVSIRKQFD